MRITALAGGTGAAKLLRGLVACVDPAALTIIGNTGDEAEIWGLHVSPDLDSVLYALAGLGGQGLSVGFIAWLWTSVALVVALREAMRLETGKAVATMLLTYAIVAVINFITGMALGAPCLLLNRLGL